MRRKAAEAAAGDCPDFCVSKNGTVPFDASDGDSHGQAASADEPRERVYVDIDTFEATF
ncbi:MAG: hypothetical protein WCB27_21635 [Thermoguttaceae bacterium]|jgi:hypothetical protein